MQVHEGRPFKALQHHNPSHSHHLHYSLENNTKSHRSTSPSSFSSSDCTGGKITGDFPQHNGGLRRAQCPVRKEGRRPRAPRETVGSGDERRFRRKLNVVVSAVRKSRHRLLATRHHPGHSEPVEDRRFLGVTVFNKEDHPPRPPSTARKGPTAKTKGERPVGMNEATPITGAAPLKANYGGPDLRFPPSKVSQIFAVTSSICQQFAEGSAAINFALRFSLKEFESLILSLSW